MTESGKLIRKRLHKGLSSPCAAADLKAVRGIEPLVAELDNDNADIRAATADVLGTAASNNIRVQQDVADVCPDIVQKLLQVCWHCRCAARSLPRQGELVFILDINIQRCTT